MHPSRDAEGNHWGDAKRVAKGMSKESRRQKFCKEGGSADGSLVSVLVLWLTKGWDSELGGLVKRSEQCTWRSTSQDQLPAYWTGLVLCS